MLLHSAFESLFLPQKLRGKGSDTKRQYEINLRHFDRFLGRAATLDDLTDENVAGVMAWLVDEGRAPATANKCRAKLLSLWRFLSRKGHVAHWPDVSAATEPTRIPRAWTEQQLGQLFNACRNTIGRIGDCRACDWWTALHAVMWDTGERIGALLDFTWDDINLDTGWIILQAESRKGRRADKATQLHPNTIALLRRIHRADGKVFPWDRSACTLWLRYDRILKRAGLPHDRKSKFHRVRKSVATHLTVLGGNAQSAMGHSSPAVTAVYIDPTIARTQQPSDILFRIDQVNWDRVKPDAG